MTRFYCALVMVALLIAVSVAKPVSNSAAEDSDDLQTAQQFGFGYGGGYSPYGNYNNGGYYRRRGSSSSSESHEHGRYYRF